jgi:hypothetical protein
LRHPELSVVVAEEQWEEAEHELARRLDILASAIGSGYASRATSPQRGRTALARCTSGRLTRDPGRKM